jgi:Mg2+ and Co2+ transporter CorA
MNTSFIPIAGMENDFWIVLSIMAIATIFMFIFFKYRKWL